MRLIDADELKEHIGSYAGMFTNEGFMVNLSAVFCGIDFQPTAYDVDAVVRELEDNYKIACSDYKRTADIYYAGKALAYDIAIEAVKRGDLNE